MNSSEKYRFRTDSWCEIARTQYTRKEYWLIASYREKYCIISGNWSIYRPGMFLSVYLCVCLSVCLYVCLSVLERALCLPHLASNRQRYCTCCRFTLRPRHVYLDRLSPKVWLSGWSRWPSRDQKPIYVITVVYLRLYLRASRHFCNNTSIV